MAVDAGQIDAEMNHTGPGLVANGGESGEGALKLTGGATGNDASGPTPPGPGAAELETAGSARTHPGPPSDNDPRSFPDDTADDVPLDNASVAGFPSESPVDGLSDTASIDDSWQIVIVSDISDAAFVEEPWRTILDEDNELAIPVWGVNRASVYARIAPEEADMGDGFLCRLLDRTSGKPGRAGNQNLASTRAARRPRRAKKAGKHAGRVKVGRRKVVVFKYRL